MGGCASRPKDLAGEAPEADDVAANVAPAPPKSTEAPAVESMVEEEPKAEGSEDKEEETKVECSEDKKEEPKIEASKSNNEEPKVEARENDKEEHKAEKTAEVTVVQEEPPVAVA
ncbi:phosphatidylinositol transfer protein sfh5-like [Zingiber officinale]|uniref:phosphatidylinositol transfer protein sfh5-like n=1 Tax=Zingiber officinale TaxID=94328 RepID=UPI001C4D82B2|nr:phosphatidylinositol transfer protein sfh5-like [Zingiber officinale]